jgi:hypothetical protein
MTNGMWRNVGKVLLFAGLWIIMTLGIYLLVLIFFGPVLTPWRDFIDPPIVYTQDHYLAPYLKMFFGVTFIATSIPAAYFAKMVVYQKPEEAEDDLWMNRIGNTLYWMIMTLGYYLFLLVVIIFLWGQIDPTNLSEGTPHQMVKEMRHFLAAAVIIAGCIAWWKLPDEKSSESREP